jgi:hypothetical protein
MKSALDEFKRVIGLPLDEIDRAGRSPHHGGHLAGCRSRDPIGESMEVAALRKSLEITAASKKAVKDQALMPYLSFRIAHRRPSPAP